MVKTVKLPERPKPPDKAQITEDLKRASDDDVIFADLKMQSCKKEKKKKGLTFE